LGLKFDTFEKCKKDKYLGHVAFGKKQKEFYVNKKCNHANKKLIYSQCNQMTIVE
jgi:hypothetical protein